MKIEWKLTDPNCNQYGRQLRNNVYEFKEDRVINPKTGETETYQSVIDLNDYTEEEMQNILDAYGLNLYETEKWIIAECLFEMED